MRTTLAARPSLPLVISTAGSSLTTSAAAAAAFTSAVGNFWTRYFAIFLTILMAAMAVSWRKIRLELAVVSFLEGIVEFRGVVFLFVVLDLLFALDRDLGAVLEREHVFVVLGI